MKVTQLFFLLLSVCRTSASTRASVIVTTIWSQYFEYEEIFVKCENFSSGEWTVWRYTTTSKRKQSLMPCGSDWGSAKYSACDMKIAKEVDSGVYWCQSKSGESSNTVNINITNGPVTLRIPVLPVTEGDNVTLHCRDSTSSNLQADFYKDGSLIRTDPTGNMTIHHVSKSDEGLYKCINVNGESPSSWLLIKGDSEPASLTVSPDSSQLFEYERLTVSCDDNSRVREWKVMRNTTHEGDRFSSCGGRWGVPTPFGCSVPTAKHHDSAVYWCESPARQRSNSVKISIYDKQPVILRSPVLPVMEGHNVTLQCKAKLTDSSLTAGFYKDGSLIRTEPTGNMTIHHVNKSDEGLYKCDISGHGESPSSWISVRDRDRTNPSTADPNLTADPNRTVCLILMLVFKGVEFLLFCICSIRLVSFCRQMHKGKNRPVSIKMSPLRKKSKELDQQYDDVIADVAIEHQF